MKQKTLLLAAGICGLTMSSHASLVAWYKFDEGAGASTAANAVAGSSTGAISANVITGLGGISGNAYAFNDLDTVVDMGNANFFSSINTAQKITLSAWVNTGTATGQKNVVVFAGNDAATDKYMDIGYSGAGDPNALPTPIEAGKAYGRDRASGNGINAAGNTPTVSVNDGAWHQVVMTIDLSAVSNQLNLYVDGALSTSQTLSGANLAFPTLNNFEVGRLGRSVPADYFNGLIDEVQVYDTALSDSDVLFLFGNPGLAVVPEPGTLALAGLGLGLLYFNSRRNRKRA